MPPAQGLLANSGAPSGRPRTAHRLGAGSRVSSEADEACSIRSGESDYRCCKASGNRTSYAHTGALVAWASLKKNSAGMALGSTAMTVRPASYKRLRTAFIQPAGMSLRSEFSVITEAEPATSLAHSCRTASVSPEPSFQSRQCVLSPRWYCPVRREPYPVHPLR